MLLYTFYVHVKTDLMKRDVAPAMVAPRLIVVYVSICKDMLKFGGPGRKKRCCVQRKFLNKNHISDLYRHILVILHGCMHLTDINSSLPYNYCSNTSST